MMHRVTCQKVGARGADLRAVEHQCDVHGVRVFPALVQAVVRGVRACLVAGRAGIDAGLHVMRVSVTGHRGHGWIPEEVNDTAPAGRAYGTDAAGSDDAERSHDWCRHVATMPFAAEVAHERIVQFRRVLGSRCESGEARLRRVNGSLYSEVNGLLASFDATSGWLHVTKSRKKGIPKGDTLRLQDTVRLSAAGAGMLLGDLEHRILKAAWSLNRPASARELHDRVARTHDVVYITSVTVANRLVEKGILRRAKHDDLYHYTATLSRDEFSERASRHVVQRIVELGSTAVSASLVEVLAERDPEQLAELGRLVRRKLREAAKDSEK